MSFIDSIGDPNVQAALMAASMVEAAIAAPPKYDTRTLDAVEKVITGRIAKSSFRETARTLNLVLTDVRKLRP